MEDLSVKIVMIGQSCVGKTSILEQYIEKKFSETLAPTIMVYYQSKFFNIEDRKIKLQIFDLSGNEIFQSINTAYVPGAQCVIIVFDVSQQMPKEYLDRWINFAKEKRGEILHEIVLVGNKNDLHRLVSVKEAEKFATEHGIHYFDVSAKCNYNIDEMFTFLATQIYICIKRITNNNIIIAFK